MFAPDKTPQALRAQVRAKLAPLLAKEAAEGARLGLKPVPITSEVVDYGLTLTCLNIIMACPAFPFLEEECARLDDEGPEGTDTRAEIAEVRARWAPEIASCDLLVRDVVKAGKARGLSDEDLLEYLYVMMTPFSMGQDRPTEAHWQAVQAEKAWERKEQA